MGASTLAFCQRLVAAGVTVIAVDELPGCLYDSEAAAEAGFAPIAPEAWAGAQIAVLGGLAGALRAAELDDVRTDTEQPWLRVYHYTGAASEGEVPEEYYFCVNEHPRTALATTLSARGADGALHELRGIRIDVLNGGETAFAGALELAPYESCLIVAGAKADTAVPVAPAREPIALAGTWHVAHADALTYPTFGDEVALTELEDLSNSAFPGTAGTYRYRLSFELDEALDGVTLDLGEVNETAEAWLDGRPLGVRLVPPYRFCAGNLAAGAHELTVEVINTVDHKMCDYFSMSEPTEPSGLIGPVTLR